jgi:tRNA-dihydrouridine synthase
MKLALSPMATLTHEALRILIHRYGDPDEYFSEMIHAPSFVNNGPLEKWYVRTAPEPDKMVWQLTGSTVPSMARAAELLAPYGGIGLDLNMGCSAPDIAKTGAGIAWMSKPSAEVASLVRAVRPSVPGRLSVKLRLGEDENYARLLDFCRILEGEGVEMVTLHPRIRKDKYSRAARRAHVARLASDLSIPVYGNGDVSSAADAVAYRSAYPCAGLMIGRAAVQKPWIFRDIREAWSIPAAGNKAGETVQPDPAPEPAVPHSSVDHLEVSRFFLETLAESQPPEFQISRAHRFFFYYCDNFTFAHHIKMRIQNAKTPGEIEGLLEEYFVQVPEDRHTAGRA